MKCKICRGPAIVQLPHYNMNLCKDHFISFVEKRVNLAITKYQMFSPSDKVLVALSGGKDSMSLWYILTKLGYKADGVFVKLGNEQQVAPALEVISKLSQIINRKFFVIDATEHLFGLTTFEAARILRRNTCAFCGKVKRYLMNKAAIENNYDVLVTGHNIDDEASLLLGNLLHWQMGYLKRSWPVLPQNHPKMARKAKPHILNYEKDIRTYTDLLEIPYLKSTCPFSIGATLPVYKNALDLIEKEQPNLKTTFYKGFLKHKNQLFPDTHNIELKSCQICGFPTTADVCSFCSARGKLEQKLKKYNKL